MTGRGIILTRGFVEFVMGVPAFFRWLSRKYPSIVVHCVEEKMKVVQGLKIPVDATLPNPNEVEFDNLYLDMNGIIHPCCHPEDKPAPENEDEMMEAIFEYIDRIFNIVRPRKVLYMAIDGVAPRAKMNQQRSRRFRSAIEAKDKLEEIKRIRSKLREDGCELPPLKPDNAHFDSNCITPGTPFMANLAICLQYYIHDRMNSNPAWKGIKVILSDANVPGEGEHKIMDYIRKQRASPGHDPNTHHCLYGADADLIMLGLATHEPYFTILREEFKPNQPRPCEVCNQYGHTMKECTGEVRVKQGEFDELATSSIAQEKQFIFIRINVLREYLQRDLKIDGLSFKYDFERVIDDWVFMCFFVGNDFLPHLPSLQIREGAIDRLITLYKDFLPSSKGYLTHNGFVDVKNVQVILAELGKVEDEIFRNRRDRDIKDKERRKQQSKRQKIEDYRAPTFIPEQLTPVPLGSRPSPAHNARYDAYQMRQSSTLASNQEAAQSMKALLKRSKSFQEPSTFSHNDWQKGERMESLSNDKEEERMKRKRRANDYQQGNEIEFEPETKRQKGERWPSLINDKDEERMKRKRQAVDDQRGNGTESDSENEDEVRLWEEGWKERYYQNKFCVSCDDVEFVRKVVESYAQGLCWVMSYYYQGCPSWKWYYPFHYAPFASDFRYIVQIRDRFERGSQPFRPLEQLMGVFPPASCKFLPPLWQNLMLDEDSDIIDFYPSNFKVDLNGKKFAWQGVALLPFVDEYRLLDALSDIYDSLTPDEKARNSLGCDCLFVHKYNRLYAFLKTLYEAYNKDSPDGLDNEPVQVNPKSSQGVSGRVWPNMSMKTVLKKGGLVESLLPHLPDIENSQVICCNFQDPTFTPGYIYEAKLLPNVIMPPPTLRPDDMRFAPPGSYRPQTGFTPRGSQKTPYRTPQSARRFIRNALSDPHDSQSRHYTEQSPYQQYQSDYRPPPQRQTPSYASWTPLPPPPSHTYSSPYQGPPGFPSYQPQQHSYHQSSYQPRHDQRLPYQQEFSRSSQSNYPQRDYNDPRGYHGDLSHDRYGTSRVPGYGRSGGPLNNEQRQQAYDPNMKRDDYYKSRR